MDNYKYFKRFTSVGKSEDPKPERTDDEVRKSFFERVWESTKRFMESIIVKKIVGVIKNYGFKILSLLLLCFGATKLAFLFIGIDAIINKHSIIQVVKDLISLYELKVKLSC